MKRDKWHLFFVSICICGAISLTAGQSKSLKSALEEEETFYTNYGLESYSKQDVQKEIISYYDLFGVHIADGFFVYNLSNEHYAVNNDKVSDSTTSSISQEAQTNLVYEAFNNLIVTRDAIGGMKSTFLIGDQIKTRFTPYTMNKFNYKGIRWDIWTSGLKFTGLLSRTRPGFTSKNSYSGRAPVQYPIQEGSFQIAMGGGTFPDWDDPGHDAVSSSPYLQAKDWTNNSLYGDYDLLWAIHAENNLANILQYGVTYMNHHRSDVEKGEKFRGDLPDGLVPNEIHLEFYDMTPERTDDAGCFLEYITMRINKNIDAGGPRNIYTGDPNDSTLYPVGLPKIQNGWEPIIATFYPANPEKPTSIPEDQIKHVEFEFAVAGNYMVFVSTDRFIPLAISGKPIKDQSGSRTGIIFDQPYTRTVDDIYKGVKGKTIPISSGKAQQEAATYFGDYIAKSPKLISVDAATFGARIVTYNANPASPPVDLNWRKYTYEFVINTNSVTYGANFKGKVFGINFSGEFETNVKESKYPGPSNSLDDYESAKVRRNVIQFKADRDIGQKFNVAGEAYYISPNFLPELNNFQASKYLSKTKHVVSSALISPDYFVEPKPLGNDWHAIDDNEDEDLYVESDLRRYPSNLGGEKSTSFYNDGALKIVGTSNTVQCDTVYLPTGLKIVYDDYDGVISDRYDRNKNGTVDYVEDFLLYNTDPPVFELGNDLNNNGQFDDEDDDITPDFPYFIPYTLTSNGFIMHGLQGMKGNVQFRPVPTLKLDIGTYYEKALNMNFTPTYDNSDKPSDDEGKCFVGYGTAMLNVVRRSEGISYFVGGEGRLIKDAIRNDVVITKNKGSAGEIDIEYKYKTDELRYRNVMLGNIVGGVTYQNLPNFEVITRLMAGLEHHMGLGQRLFYITKTRADYTYESFWERYPNRDIAKTYLVGRLGYTQKWGFEYEGWKSFINVLNRLQIIPQYKLSYEMSKNLYEEKAGEKEKDPRKFGERIYDSDNDGFLSLDELSDYKNAWQEYSNNTTNYLLSVPILRANFKIAEKTNLDAGIEWLRAFDRVTEEASYFRTMKVAQIMSRDNYAGYNIALIFGIKLMDEIYDVNRYDEILGTGKEYNKTESEVFARIYAGL